MEHASHAARPDRTLIVFFALAYSISWASFPLFGGPAVFTLGPFLAALVMAAVTGGSSGLRDLASGILRWRVPPIWYAAATSVPIGMGMIVAALTVLRGAPSPTVAQLGPWYGPLVSFAVLVLTGDTLFEETGWRAFALPRFPASRSRLANSLVLGMLLAGWHLPVAMSEPTTCVPYLIATIASAVVTNWIYYNGRESALLAWLYHTSANTTGFYLLPLFPGPARVAYFWMLAGVNVVAAVVLVAATGRDLGRRTREGAAHPVDMSGRDVESTPLRSTIWQDRDTKEIAMLDTPRIVDSAHQLTAVIRLTIPREEIRSVMGPAITEVRTAVAAQGMTPSGPWFSYHFRMDPAVFDFEVGVPMSSPVAAAGRVKAGHLPAARVARTVYRGAYEGLPDAWGEFDGWITANGYTKRGDLWERYVVGPESSADPATWCTELNRPLRL